MELGKNNDVKVISAWKIYEILELIRKKPHFCLTAKTITALQNFLNGYIMLMGYSDKHYNPNEPKFDEFKYWILNKDKKSSGVGNVYSHFLLRKCKGNEEKAFDKFFEYLDEFKNEHKKTN